MKKVNLLFCLIGISILGLIVVGCASQGGETKPPLAQAPKSARQPAQAHGAGRLTVDQIVYDFGTVEPGQTLEGSFLLRNEGKGPLTIKKIGKSCGCTVTALDTDTLEPGQSTPLKVTFTAGKYSGKTSKKIWVLTEPPASPNRLNLSIVAEIKEIIECEPAQLTFQLNPNISPQPQKVSLKSADGQPFRIMEAGCLNKSVTITSDDMDQSRLEHSLTVSYDPQKLLEYPNGLITLKTDHPKVEKINIQFRSTLPYEAHPSTKSFLGLEPGQSKQAFVKVVSNFGQDFEISRVYSEKGLVHYINTEKTDDGFRVNFTFQLPEKTGENDKKVISDYLIMDIKEYPDFPIRVRCFGKVR